MAALLRAYVPRLRATRISCETQTRWSIKLSTGADVAVFYFGFAGRRLTRLLKERFAALPIEGPYEIDGVKYLPFEPEIWDDS
jgi:hypothetical protein